jgi:hypothetical protein
MEGGGKRKEGREKREEKKGELTMEDSTCQSKKTFSGDTTNKEGSDSVVITAFGFAAKNRASILFWGVEEGRGM